MSEDLLMQALTDARDRKRLPSPERRRAIRERGGVSQTTVAKTVGATPAAVSRWEAGARAPRGPFLRRYLEVLDRLAQETV